MEIVRKVVNLKDFTEKIGEKEPFIGKDEAYGGSSYGKIPYDIQVDENFPFIMLDMPMSLYRTYYGEDTGYTEKYGIRYGTFMSYYNWLRNFVLQSKYYILGKRKETYIWVETGSTYYKASGETEEGKYYLFTGSTGVFKYLPDTNDYICGETIICVNENADNFLVESESGGTIPFFEKYGIYDAKDFLDYSEYIFDGQYVPLSPFVEIPLFIDEKIDNVGLMDLYYPQEEANIIVNDSGNASYGEDYHSGTCIHFNYAIYKSDIVEEGYYLCVSDDADVRAGMVFKPEHWEKITENLGSTEYNEFYETGVTEYFVESKLKTLIRQKTSVDDNGKTLDFYYREGSEHCGLIYTIGTPQNVAYDDKIEVYKYDIISSIECLKEDGDEYDYSAISSEDIGTKGTIKFIYVIGNMLSGDTSVNIVSDDSGGGIEYEETYNFEIKNATFTINGMTRTMPYLKIDYTSSERPENSDNGVLYAKVKILNTEDPYFDIYHLISNDNLVGIEDVMFDEGEIKINRGTSSSFEAFNVLGEVNTLDDIENYRDDWYRIRGKND